VHGVGGNHMSWFQQVPHFANHYTVVTYDQRGWGFSRGPEGGPGGAAFVDDLAALLDHLGIERAHVVAQSMGGWTALGLAYRRPERVRSLVLADTHGGLETGEIRTAIRLGGPQSEPAPLPFRASQALDARFARDHPALAFLYNQISELNPPRVAPMDEHLRSINRLSSEQAASVRCPTLFIVGERDEVIPPATIELARRLLPNARISRVPATGHSVYFERPLLFNRIVDEFLSSLRE